jgi:hypothetical protein
MITDNLVVALRLLPIGALGIESFVNLTPEIRQMTVNRGKSSIFSDFPAGSVQIELNNNERQFDPTITSFRKLNPESNAWDTSQIMGRRSLVRVGFGLFDSLLGIREIPGSDGIGTRIFTGYTNDWNLGYDISGQSIASLTLFDFSGLFSELFLEADIPDVELSGERFRKIYGSNRPIGIPNAVADNGVSLLGDQLIPENVSVVTYLNLIARTEGGYSFNDRLGRGRLVQRIKSSGTDLLRLGENGIGISRLSVSFGTELLYNRIKVENIDELEVQVDDLESQEDNGLKELDLRGLLGANEGEAETLANYYLRNYSRAKLRFNEVEISVRSLDAEVGIGVDQNKLIRTEIGDFVEVSYRPNNIGDVITQTRRIIGIRHTIRPTDYVISFALDDFTHNNFILDDEQFGRLDVNQLL